MERQDYQVVQENDVSRDLNVVNVENQVEMTFAHLQFEKLPEGVFRVAPLRQTPPRTPNHSAFFNSSTLNTFCLQLVVSHNTSV